MTTNTTDAGDGERELVRLKTTIDPRLKKRLQQECLVQVVPYRVVVTNALIQYLGLDPDDYHNPGHLRGPTTTTSDTSSSYTWSVPQ